MHLHQQTRLPRQPLGKGGIMDNSNSQTIAYRPDIDGLRAVAVLLVVAFHAFPTRVQGGFMGVDIFFVISGYLICWIILKDLEQESFSFSNFYARRILRIFPALLLVLATALVTGWLTLLPDEYRALGKHIFGGAAFIDNILLWRETGYFDAAAKAKPLLHLWSLGIEEQFYIVFPLLLWLSAKRHFRAAGIILILGLLSFMDNIYLHRIDGTANFYSPLPRIWELLAGAALCAVMRQASTRKAYLKIDTLCARLLYQKAPDNDGRSLSLALATLGVILFGMGLLLSRQDKPWPGWHAVFPVTGTLAFIAAGPLNGISRYLLCNRFAVFVGKISYPFYLWHWPFLSYAFILNAGLDSGTRFLRVGLIGLAFVLAVGTYFFVEKPIRFGVRARTGKVYALVAAMLLLAGAGLSVKLLDGLPERTRFKEIAAALKQLERPLHTDDAAVRYAGITKDTLTYCRYTDAGADTTVAVVGDSHAQSAYHGIAQLGRKVGYNTLLLGWWIPGGEVWSPGLARKEMRPLLEILKKKKDIRKVFICTRGMCYITATHNAGDRDGVFQSPPVGEELFRKSLQKFVAMLHASGKEVFIIAENPELPADIRDYINRNSKVMQGKNSFPDLYKADVIHRQQLYLAILSGIKDATIVGTIEGFCPTDKCTAFSDDGLPLYYDDDHLSFAGSVFQADHILRPYLVARPQ